MEGAVKRTSTAAVASLLTSLAFSFAGGVAAAQGVRPVVPLPTPVLKLPPNESPARLARMDVRVTVAGLESEIVTTLTFSNPNARQLAGDLEFPLPDGAAVAGYALDIGGRMVDGVGVTKQKARVVLETEMRRRVDPGLVEHVRGNVFRTRIFPLPPRGERTVRIVTVAPLTLSGGDAACHVPLPRVAIPTLALRVEIVKGAVKPQLGGFGNLSLTEWSDRWVAESTLTNSTPGDDLYIRLPKLPPMLTTIEELGGERYVAISHAPTFRESPAAHQVDRVAIAWDASGSRGAEAVRKDRALLAALLATPTWQNATVDLVVFRDRPEAVRTFVARAGKAPDLLAFLDQLPYDGGTDLAALDLRRNAAPNAGDAAWLLFTDGLYTLGAGLPKFGGLPVHVVASDTVRDAALQRFLAAATGGQVVDLALTEPPAAAALLASPPATLIRVDAAPGTLADVQYGFTPGSGRATVYAQLLRGGEVTLVYGSGGREMQRVPVPLPAGTVPPGRVVARAWAGRMVEELAVFPERNEAAMADLGRRFGLVTPVTSLIVLENVQQYLEHEIEPPATWPEMRQQYLAGLEARKGRERQQRTAKIDRVLAWWKERVSWWEREFSYAKDFRWKAPADVAPGRPDRGVVGGVVGGAVGGVAAEAPVVAGAARAAAPALAQDRVAMLESEKSVGQQAAGTSASIAIKPWAPDTPYLKAIKGAAPARAYAAYLEQRKTYLESPAFYLDCAGALLPVDKVLGLRVLSNLAELKLDDAALLRAFAWRLGEAAELDRAIEVLDRVRGLRPEDPQSLRDLALVLADRMDRDRRGADGLRAARLLNDVIVGEWSRFEEVEVVVLMELNRVLARLERLDPASYAKVDFVDGRLRKPLDVDVRIVMSWDADNTDIDLHVVEPSGEEAFYGHNLTTIGGHVSRDFTQGYGPEEYVLRRAMPGVYKIRCRYYGSSQQTLVGPATVAAVVITNFGRPNERRQTLTLRLDKVREMVDIGEVTIGGGAAPVTDARPAPRVTRAMVEGLPRGAERADVERRLGPPSRVERSGVTVLVYMTAEGNDVRLGFGPALLWAREVYQGAERDLTLR
jgi:Ca-activated chloride channel family protein